MISMFYTAINMFFSVNAVINLFLMLLFNYTVFTYNYRNNTMIFKL